MLSEQNEQLLQTKIAPTPKPRSRTPIKDISGIHEEDTSTGDAKPDTALFKEQSIREGQLKTTQIERINELREEPETCKVTHCNYCFKIVIHTSQFR